MNLNPLTCVYRVTCRSIDKHGTSEQYHSGTKSDIGIERFPAGKFATNQLILALGALAYNLLRAIDHRVIDLKTRWREYFKKRGAKLQRRRVGSIIRDIIGVAAKIVSHAGKRVIKIADGWPWSRVIIAIDRQLA